MTMRRWTTLLLVVLALVTSACGEDGPTVEVPAADAARFDTAGPESVGVVTVEDPDATVEIWYPAESTNGEGAEYSLGAWLPDVVVQLVGEDALPVQETTAVRDATPAAGTWPLVIFSHGFGGFRTQSAGLAVRLASWGFVVAAPDHPQRGLSAALLASGRGDDTAQLVAARDLTVGAAADGAIPAVAENVLAAVGHSAGARATAEGIEDLDARAWVGWAPAGSPPDAVDALVIAGADDAVTPVGDMRNPADAEGATLVILPDAGHLAFSDLCTIGAEDGGLVGIARDRGLPVPERLAELATDGCGEGQLVGDAAVDLIGHVTVAFLRDALGLGTADGDLDSGVLPDGADVVAP